LYVSKLTKKAIASSLTFCIWSFFAFEYQEPACTSEADAAGSTYCSAREALLSSGGEEQISYLAQLTGKLRSCADGGLIYFRRTS